MKSVYPMKSIGDVLALEYGKPLPGSERDPEGGVPAYGANGVLCWSKKAFRKQPSIIVGRKGSAGEVTLTKGPFWPTDVTYFVEHDERVTDLRYLFHILKFLKLQGLAKGVKPGINRNDVYSLRAPIPVLSEQKRIVTILDEAFEGIDAAVANARKNLASARNLFERCMSSAFDRQSETRSRTVRELAASDRGSIRTGPFGSQLLHGEFVDAGIAVLGIDNVVENRFTWNRRRYITPDKYANLRRYTVKPGDVLISIMGTCGRCAVVPNDIKLAINSKHLCCISLDRTKCIPEYLHAYFLFHPVAREYLSSQSTGSIMDGLNMRIIQEMPVLVPPLVQQKTIAEFFETASNASNRLADIQIGKIALLGDLRQSILAKAFAGELTAQPKKALPEAAE